MDYHAGMGSRATRFLLLLLLCLGGWGTAGFSFVRYRHPVAAPAFSRLQASVEKVVAGDTLHVRVGGTSDRIRLLGIDTPEITMGKNQRWGKEARNRLEDLLLDRHDVALETVEQGRDKYGRLLVFLWLPPRRDKGETREVMANLVLVREGYARVKTYGQPLRYREKFVAEQALAQKEKLRLWQEEKAYTLDQVCCIRIRNAEVIEVRMLKGPWVKRDVVRRKVLALLEEFLLQGDEDRIALLFDRLRGLTQEGGGK